jgi:hypothetical protein
MIACDHCEQFGVNKTECQHCGAPMPEKIVYYPEDEYTESSYWGNRGLSMGDDSNFWAS